MNPIDILGGLLKKRGRSGGGGLGGALLEGILKGGRKKSSPGAQVDMQRPAGSPTIIKDPHHEEFDSLEDLLHYSKHKHRSRRGQLAEREEPTPDIPNLSQRQSRIQADYEANPQPFNDRAKILVVAMINAAKADGHISDDEQQQVLKQLGSLSQDEIDFLRTEFARPVNVRDFAWSVPLGMEEQVYGVSLLAIDADNLAEMDYLKELAHGLRLTPARTQQIQTEFS